MDFSSKTEYSAKNQVIVMEGYTDVLIAHQFDLKMQRPFRHCFNQSTNWAIKEIC